MNIEKGRTISPLQFLSFQKSNVFVNCGSADVADPSQFADVQLPFWANDIGLEWIMVALRQAVARGAHPRRIW